MTAATLPELNKEQFRELLAVRAGKSDDDRILLEGQRLVADALQSQITVDCLVFSDDERGRRLEKTLGAVLPEGLSRYRLRGPSFQRLCETKTPQGVIAAARLAEASLADMALSAEPPWLILDELGDPGNVGTLLRSAEAFGFRTVIRLGGARFRQAKVVRASMGAALRLALAEAPSAEMLLERLEKAGLTLYVADFGGAPPDTVTFDGDAFALLVGSEAHGVSDAFRSQPHRLSIPMQGGESLNAAVAGSILMYEMRRNDASSDHRRR